MGDYNVEFTGGKLLASVNVKKSEGPVDFNASIGLALDAGKVIDAIEAAIPGKLDDAVLEILRKYLVPAT